MGKLMKTVGKSKRKRCISSYYYTNKIDCYGTEGKTMNQLVSVMEESVRPLYDPASSPNVTTKWGKYFNRYSIKIWMKALVFLVCIFFFNSNNIRYLKAIHNQFTITISGWVFLQNRLGDPTCRIWSKYSKINCVNNWNFWSTWWDWLIIGFMYLLVLGWCLTQICCS